MKITERKEGNITVITVDPGETVLCDICNKNYTNSVAEGGILFLSKAVCPDCAPDLEATAKMYKEEGFILDRARENESFRDFVYRIRDKK